MDSPARSRFGLVFPFLPVTCGLWSVACSLRYNAPMTKKRLMTPGPTQVPEAARLAMAREVIHHRSPEFKAIMAEVLAGLKYVLQTDGDVIVLTASGLGRHGSGRHQHRAARRQGDRAGRGRLCPALDAHLPGVRHRGRAARNSLGLRRSIRPTWPGC